MSYRENRRDRSRSRSPPTRGEKRGRSRSPPARRGRSRSPDRRDRNYDRRDRGADRSDNRDSKDEFGRLRTGGNERRHDDRYSMSNHQQPVQSQKVQPEAQKDLKQLRAEAEAARKERLEMVKNITGDNDDNKKIKPQRAATEGETEEDLQEEQEEDMMEALGFSGFNSTKGKQVADNVYGSAAGSVAKHKERKYRQYMNRRGGFNRPLQKMD